MMAGRLHTDTGAEAQANAEGRGQRRRKDGRQASTLTEGLQKHRHVLHQLQLLRAGKVGGMRQRRDQLGCPGARGNGQQLPPRLLRLEPVVNVTLL